MRVAVRLVVLEGGQGQPVAFGRVLVGPADDDRGDGQAGVRQVEEVGDRAHRVQRGPHVADPEPLRLEAQADVLRDDHRVEGRDVVAQQVVEVVARAAPAQPLAGAEPVGAERDDERRLQHHVLLEAEVRTASSCRSGSRVSTIETLFRFPEDEPPAIASPQTASISAGSIGSGL